MGMSDVSCNELNWTGNANCDKLVVEFGAELAKKLQGIDLDPVWGELAQLEASKNPKAPKLAGPLHHAAQSGYKDMCKLIIKQCKCDINAATIDGNYLLDHHTMQIDHHTMHKCRVPICFAHLCAYIVFFIWFVSGPLFWFHHRFPLLFFFRLRFVCRRNRVGFQVRGHIESGLIVVGLGLEAWAKLGL